MTIHFRISELFLNNYIHLLYWNQLDWVDGSIFTNRDTFYKKIGPNETKLVNALGQYLMS